MATTPPSKLPAAVEAVVAEAGGGSEASREGGGTEPSKLPVPPTTPLQGRIKRMRLKRQWKKEALVDGRRRRLGPCLFLLLPLSPHATVVEAG